MGDPIRKIGPFVLDVKHIVHLAHIIVAFVNAVFGEWIITVPGKKKSKNKVEAGME